MGKILLIAIVALSTSVSKAQGAGFYLSPGHTYVPDVPQKPTVRLQLSNNIRDLNINCRYEGSDQEYRVSHVWTYVFADGSAELAYELDKLGFNNAPPIKVSNAARLRSLIDAQLYVTEPSVPSFESADWLRVFNGLVRQRSMDPDASARWRIAECN